MGGTITSIFASLHPELPIRNLIFMTSPFDFEDAGLMVHILDERYFDIDKVVETLGLIPPEMIDFGNKMIKSNGTNFMDHILVLLIVQTMKISSKAGSLCKNG